MDDLDVYRSALAKILAHGEEAELHAAMRIDALVVAGDMNGVSAWKRVLAAIKTIRNTEPTGRVQ